MISLLILIPTFCSNTCSKSYSNVCDTTNCLLGTDCYDCGYLTYNSTDNNVTLESSFNSTIMNTSLTIVNGMNAEDGQFPSLVSLQVNNRHHCTGFFIHEKFIITAAHCFRNVVSFEVVVNDTSIHSSNRVNTLRIIVHPQFSYHDHLNDIGILELTTAFPNIPILKIATPSTNIQTFTISGWGTREFGGLASDLLYYTTATLTRIELCISNYAFLGENRVYANSDVCTIPWISGPCQGDSGAPLFDANRLETIAIVRMQYGCANAYNTIYTRLDIHKNFICTHVPVSGFCNTNDLLPPPPLPNQSPMPPPIGYTHQVIVTMTIQNTSSINNDDLLLRLSSYLYVDQSLLTVRSNFHLSASNRTVSVFILTNGITNSEIIRDRLVNVSLSSLSSTLGISILDIESTIEVISIVPSSPPLPTQSPPSNSYISLIVSLSTSVSGLIFCIIASVLSLNG